jgi:hypothetical protein
MKNTSACDDCVVSVLVGDPIVVGKGEEPGLLEIDDAEKAAIDALADAGLVPHLRLMPGRGDPPRRATG